MKMVGTQVAIILFPYFLKMLKKNGKNLILFIYIGEAHAKVPPKYE